MIRRPSSGFSLVEIMIAVVIIGIFLAIALPNYFKSGKTSQKMKDTSFRKRLSYMRLRSKRALTLVESLVSIVLLGALLVSMLGAFVVSKTSAVRARHRVVAMNLVKEYLEKESSAGFHSGDYATFLTGDAILVPFGEINYYITPYPYPAVLASEDGVQYKTIGFNVAWNEHVYNSSGSITCSEKAATYVANHTSA